MAILVLERRRRRDERAIGRDRHSPYSPGRGKTGDPFQGDTKNTKLLSVFIIKFSGFLYLDLIVVDLEYYH